jgi:hypothetical protein
MQRNYATNEIAIMDTKKMYCLQAWKQCTVAGSLCFHGDLPCQKDLFPSGQTPQSLASASYSSHERALPVVQMPRNSRYNTSRARRGSSTPGLSHATPGLSHGGGTYYHSGNSTLGRAQRGRSSRRRIRWPWWLEPSSNACIYSNSYFFDLEQVSQWLQQASQCRPVQDHPQTRSVHQS